MYGLLDPEYEAAIADAYRQGKIVHHGCIMMPWRWWCPECQFPIPSEDDYWGNASEEQRNEALSRHAHKERLNRAHELLRPLYSTLGGEG